MLRFVAFLAIIQLVRSECVKGPSYWCQSVETANECGAFKHCLQSVWSKEGRYTSKRIAAINSKECSKCTECLFGEMSKCPDNMSALKNEIGQLFEFNLPRESICKLIGECVKKPVEGKTDLRRCSSKNSCANLDMAVKCSSLTQCMTQWKKLPKHQLKKPTAELSEVENSEVNTCGFCIFVMTKYQSVIAQNSTEVDIENYLDSACRLLPSVELSRKCLVQVNTYLPQLINILRDNADPGVVCRVIQLCHDKYMETTGFDLSQVKFKVMNPEKVIIKTPLQTPMKAGSAELNLQLTKTNGMGCQACTVLVDAAKFLVKNEVDNTKVLKFLEKNLCPRLGKYNDSCNQYIAIEGNQILQFLEDEIEPAVICASLGLCMKTQMSLARENSVDLKVNDHQSCNRCQLTMDHIKKMMKTSYSEYEALEYIKKDFCMKNGDMKYLCTSTMDAYSELILAIIEQDIKSHQLCNMFNVCRSEFTITDLTMKDSTTTQIAIGDDNNCVVCQFLMKLLDQYIYQESTEEEIKAGLDKVCKFAFPAQYKDQCVQFVETYTDTICFLIAKKIPAEYVCETIGACKETTHIQEFLKNNDLSDNKKILIGADESRINKMSSLNNDQSHSKCILCEFTINIFAKIMKKNASQQELFNDLKKVCTNEMPANLRNECSALVAIYGPEVVTLILNNLEPSVICEKLKLCPPTPGSKLLGSEELYKKLSNVHLKKTEVNMINLKPSKLVKKVSKDLKVYEDGKEEETMGCTLCIYTAQLTQNFLKKNKTEEEIEEELQLVCNYFPSQLSAQCTSFVDEYGPYVIQLAIQELDPKQVCAELKLCGQNSIKTVFDYKEIMSKPDELYQH